jgi:cyclase
LGTTSLLRPSVLYKDELFFDDGARRVELHYLGVAHTHGDTFAWLPKEKVLFTGDACVNGAYNNVRDGDVGAWIKTLEAAKELGARIVCPGHGPMGGPEIIVDQQQFFVELYARVQALFAAGRTPDEARAAVSGIGGELTAIPTIARYVGGGLGGQVEKVWTELGGAAFPK